MALKNTWTTGESFTATAANDVATEILGINARGVYASLPAVGHPGRKYFCTDNGNTYYDNGTTWEIISVAGTGMPGTEPPSASWTTSTLGSATLAADKGARLLTIPSAASENWRYERRTLSPTSNYTITGYVSSMPTVLATDAFSAGLILGDGTKFYSFGLVSMGTPTAPFSTGWNVGIRKWTNATTLSAEGGWVSNLRMGGTPPWLRIRDNATNLFFEYSFNGIDWWLILSEARTTFLTANVYGWGGNNNTGASGTARLHSLTLA